jgi:hypothetical protein
MKKILLGLIFVVSLFSTVHAQEFTPARVTPAMFTATNVRPMDFKVLTNLQMLRAMGGLTWYKKFSYCVYSSELNADFALGLPTATFSLSSGALTCTAAGYSATTTRGDILRYPIANNRSAAVETIIIRFQPLSAFSNDGQDRYILRTDTPKRSILKVSSRNDIAFYPNQTDSAASVSTSTTNPLGGTTYTICCIAYGPSETKNSEIFTNGNSVGSNNTDYVSPTLGTYSFIGVSDLLSSQLNGTILSIALFNRALSISEILILNGLM